SVTQVEKTTGFQDKLKDDPKYQQLKEQNIKQITQAYRAQGMPDFEAKKKAETVVANAETTIMKSIMESATTGQKLTLEQLKPLIPSSITDEKIRDTVLQGLIDMQERATLYACMIYFVTGDESAFAGTIRGVPPVVAKIILENGSPLKAFVNDYAAKKGIRIDQAFEELWEAKEFRELCQSAIDGKYNKELESKLREAKGLTTDKETVDKQVADAFDWGAEKALDAGVSASVVREAAAELAKDNKYIWDAVKDLLSNAVKDVAEKIGAMRAEEMTKEAMAKELERLKKLLTEFINKETVDRIIAILTDEKFKLEERKQKTQTKAPSKEKKEIDSLIETELKQISEAQTSKKPLAAMVPRRIG
ncbi:MAG: hypothetical protein QXT05_03595, partial [Candidatus Bilamarchaeaceae archaeon]